MWNMLRIVIASICLLALVTSVLSQCAQDFECGKSPYRVCNGGVNDCRNTLKGLGVDSTTNDIYFAQICRTNARFSNITFKKLSASGGVPVAIAAQQQVPEAVNPDAVFDVVGGNLYFSTQSSTPGHLLTMLSLSTLTQSATTDTGAYFQGAIEFDITNRKTYVCNLATAGSASYTIDSFSGILGQDATTRSTLYSLAEACAAVRILGSDIYFAVPDESSKTTKFYKGSSTCVSCSTAPQLLFTLNKKVVTDFDVTTDKIFYSTTNGVFSSNFDGKNVVCISWSNGASGIRVLGNRVIWNSGVAIISANLNGDDVHQLNEFSGTCGCRQGFSTDACNVCSGGLIQWVQGIPTCVITTNPATCTYDYDCPNTPYAYCDGSCKCRPGFSGDLCNSCAGAVSWKAGVPSCH